jgi:hypothetical protein
MAPRFLLFNLIDGKRIVNLAPRAGTWSDDLDTPEAVQCTIGLNNPIVSKLDLPNLATTGKAGLAAIDTGLDGTGAYVLAAGPLWAAGYDKKGESLQLTGAGLGSLFGKRSILPPSAKTYDVTQWTVPDPSDTTKQMPNPALSSVYTGISLGTIMKRLVQQSLTWPGGSLPINFPADEADSDVDHERTYIAPDFKPVKEALDQLTGVIGGPEYNFLPRFNSDRTGIVWDMQIGTVADPLIHSQKVTRWNVTVKESPVSDLSVDYDASSMGSISWMLGGRQDDDVLVARAVDDTLTNQGYPLMEVVDTSHTSVSIQSTLDDYAAANLLISKTPTETWSFKVRAHPVDKEGRPAGAQLGDYGVGDFVQLAFSDFDRSSGRGDLFFRKKRLVPLRIIGLSGDAVGEYVTIKCAPVVG